MIPFTPIDYPEQLRKKSNYFEFYSIKNKRNIQVYGTYAYYHSLKLELDYNTIAYCEYPYNISLAETDKKPYNLVFDFGVLDRFNNRIIHNYHNDYSTKAKESSYYEESWCKTNSLGYKDFSKEELSNNGFYLTNLRYLYGILKRTNVPGYMKYLNDLLNIIINDNCTLQQLLLTLNISSLDLYKVIALGIANGQLELPLKDNILNLNMKVRQVML